MAVERTCCVCRKKDEKKNLFRFVFSCKPTSSCEVSVDIAHRLAGRGAYVHQQISCLHNKQVLSFVFASLNKVRGKKSLKNVEKQISGAAIAVILEEAIQDTQFNNSFAKNARMRLLQLKNSLQDVKSASKQIRL